MNKSNIAIGVLSVVCVVTITTTIVMAVKSNKAQNKVNELVALPIDDENARKQCDSQKAVLRDQITELEKVKKVLEEGNADLSNKNTTLQSRVKELEKKNCKGSFNTGIGLGIAIPVVLVMLLFGFKTVVSKDRKKAEGLDASMRAKHAR